MKQNALFIYVTWVACAALSACESAPPSVPAATPQNTTAEGLVRVENSRFDEVYVRPGFDLADYDAVILAPVSISYKSARPDNELNNRQLELMHRYFTEELKGVFIEGGQYMLAEEADSATMRIHAAITDLEINVPTDRPAIHRNVVFVASSGQMTLVTEIYDAQTGQALVRIKDRRLARNHWHKVTSVSEWSEVRAAFRYWSQIAKDRIDAAHSNRL